MSERRDNLVNGMVLEHFLGNPQGWRWRTLLDLKAIDARLALLLQPRFRRFECFIHPRSDAVERLLRHRHCSHFTAAYGLQPPHGLLLRPPISFKRLGNVVNFRDVSPCVQQRAPRTASARHCASTCARGICRPACRIALGFTTLDVPTNLPSDAMSRVAARVAQLWCPRLKISRGAPGSAYIGGQGTRGDRRSIPGLRRLHG
jgi:hypothetical protein